MFTQSRKSNATKTIRKELKIMQIRFNAKVVFFRTDKQKSLRKRIR